MPSVDEPAWTDSHLEVEAQLKGGRGALCRLPFWSLGSLGIFWKIEESSIDLAWGPLSSQAPSLVTLTVLGARLVSGENGPGERVVMKSHPSQ